MKRNKNKPSKIVTQIAYQSWYVSSLLYITFYKLLCIKNKFRPEEKKNCFTLNISIYIYKYNHFSASPFCQYECSYL